MLSLKYEEQPLKRLRKLKIGVINLKKVISLSFVLIILTVLSAFTFSSCGKKSYGDVLGSMDELKTKMAQENLDFKYPSYLGEGEKDAERQFATVKESSTDKYYGYKIYQFGSPFYVSVTAFSGESDKMLSDEPSRTAFHNELESENGKISVFSGKGHKDALYLIGCINISGNHYEIRITSDETMENNEYVHAIYENNEYYRQALDLMVKVADSIR